MNKLLSAVFSILIYAAVFVSPASAVSTSPFDTPLSAGDATYGDITAIADENFGSAFISFMASTDLIADISYTVTPYTVLDSISLALSHNNGANQGLALSFNGAGALSYALSAGDTLSLIVSGVAGLSGNTVNFDIQTRAPSVVPVPATLPLIASALVGLGLVSWRRKAA